MPTTRLLVSSCAFALLIIGGLVLYRRRGALKQVMRRAALDIGSGTCKLTIAEVDVSNHKIANIISEHHIDVLFGHDFKKSPERKLSDEILSEGLAVLDTFQTIVKKCDASIPIVGIATAVFRESINGLGFIHTVRDKLNINLQLISQEDEAQIGFLTALAASGSSMENIVSWDSGGASFQIATMSSDDSQLVILFPII